ncbi:MAG TPA: type 4a pilus biogenesis protein PilO [Nitrospiria bacterium]|nr:type 4a pilus biogenesis protein PilO [Nitrospiria bacterium]HUK57522.1 type 4a pilus biogenesis protein PilO [Nitrospiria bacterium]
MNLDFIKNLPTYQKLLALFLINILIIAMFFWFFYLPQNNEVAGLRADIAKLDGEIGIQRAKVEKLDQLKKENAELEKQLAEKKEQLPPEAEVATLLKQVSDLGLRVGLDFKLWRPSAKKEDPSGLYSEIPVEVEVGGGYHTTALFFDSVSQLPRIVNITNIKMGSPHVERGRLMIQTAFVATAFAASEEKPASPDDKKKAQAGAKGKAAPAKSGKTGPPGGE